MKTRLFNRLKYMGVLAPIMLAVSCGLFTPRDSEPPSGVFDADPANFSGLFTDAIPALENPLYEQLFSDTIVYQQGGQFQKNKTRLVERMKLIQAVYPGIDVDWDHTETPLFLTTGITGLDSVRYAIYLGGGAGVSPPDFTGYCYFQIAYTNGWQIFSWADIPDNPRGNYSFFNPDFPSTP